MNIKNIINLKSKFKSGRIVFVTIILTFFYIIGLNAEVLTSPTWGYSLDLPENYVLAEREGNTSYFFQHSIQPVDLQIALYSKEKFPNVAKTAEHLFSQLNMKHKDKPFIWQNKNAYLSMVEFEYAPSKKHVKKKLAGWVLVIELPKEKGYLAMLTYTDFAKAKECEPLMISSLDTIFTTPPTYLSAGPVTTALYPKLGEFEIEDYKFNGKNIKFKVDKSDIDANKSVVDREFKLLTLYLKQKTVYEAWKRYYRIIFRDAWARILPFTLAVQMDNPDLLGKKGILSEKTAKLLLKYVQHFQYVRDRKGSDFTNLPEAVLDKSGDCDARALLMVLMLKQMNIDAVLLIAPNKRHSVLAVDCGGKIDNSTDKHYFKHLGKDYIMGETTAKVELGNLDPRLNGADWFAVDFYIDATAE